MTHCNWTTGVRLIERLDRLFLSMVAIPCALSARELDEFWVRNAAARLIGEPKVNASTGIGSAVEPQAPRKKTSTLD